MVRLAWRRGTIRDECAHRMACHLTHGATPDGRITNLPRVIAAYQAAHHVRRRTAWKDLARLVDLGLVRKVRGAAPGRAATYTLVLDLAKLPPDFPRDLGRAIEKVVDDPAKRAKGIPTLAQAHGALALCGTGRYGAASDPSATTLPFCGRVHTSPYTREGPTPPPPQPSPGDGPNRPWQGPWGDKHGYNEQEVARRVLAGCVPLWLAQRTGHVPPGTETPAGATLATLEHLVVLLLRYAPPGEVTELLTGQTRTALDLAGVVRYRAGRWLRSLRRRTRIRADEDGERYAAWTSELARRRAEAAEASQTARRQAADAARAARARRAQTADRWERADTAAGSIRWATEQRQPPTQPATWDDGGGRQAALARAIARARAERATRTRTRTPVEHG